MEDVKLREKFYEWAETKWAGEYLSIHEVDRLMDAFIEGYRSKEREVRPTK